MTIVKNINTQNDIKAIAKNIKQALSEIKYDAERGLSQATALNLASRAVGFANYNTANAHFTNTITTVKQDKDRLAALMYAQGIEALEASIFLDWVDKYSEQNIDYLLEVFLEEPINEAEVSNYYATVFAEILENVMLFAIPEDMDSFYLHEAMNDKQIIKDIRNGLFATKRLSKALGVPPEMLRLGFEEVIDKKQYIYTNSQVKKFLPSEDLTVAISLASKSAGTSMININEVKEVLGITGKQAVEKVASLRVRTQINKNTTVEIQPIAIFNPLSDGMYQVESHWLFNRYITSLA